MRYGLFTLGHPIYALVVVSIVTFTANVAYGGSYVSEPSDNFGPRWSNDRHHENGLIVRPGCVALPPGAGAKYIPGRDPWGRPVIPAEPPNNAFPAGVGIDVILGSKHIAGWDIELHGGYLAFDPATNQFPYNGRDCLPPPK